MGKRNWRDDPATPGQRRKIYAQGGNGDLPRTKGEASDMINRGGSGGSGCLVLIVPVVTAALSGFGYFAYKFWLT